VSIRHSTENGPPLSDADLAGITKAQRGFTLGQLYPSINPLGIIPQARFTGVTGAAAITYDGRTPLTGDDRLYTFNDTVTVVRGRHTAKAGMYFEHVRNEEGPTATFAGSFDFSSSDANNPLNTGYAYANALLGNFTTYTESTTRPGGGGLANVAEWFVQDTWRATPKLTLDYGLRLAWYSHYRHESGGASAFSL